LPSFIESSSFAIAINGNEETMSILLHITMNCLFIFFKSLHSSLKKFGFHDVFSISLSNSVSNPGKKNTTIKNASRVPRPSRIPIEEIIGSVDVSQRMKPTLDKMDAETPIE